jgi:hypothetical protein
MAYTSFAVVVLGFAIGVAFRLKVLLPILGFLLIFSVALALIQGLDFRRTIFAVVKAQSIVQAAYFGGLLFRSFIDGARRTPIL